MTSIQGFQDANVSYTCEDAEHFNVSSGKIKRDIADVRLEIKAEVSWKGEKKTTLLFVTIKRIQEIKIKNTDLGGTHTIIWDFSQEGTLTQLRDGKPIRIWVIKSVDFKKKQLVAKLKKLEEPHTDELLEPTAHAKYEIKLHRDFFEDVFRATYLALN